MTTEQANRISIKTYLEQSGIYPVKEKERYGMYHSPLRADSNPSFKVDFVQNFWYDFGTAEGGTMIDLVMKMNNYSLVQAIEHLKNGGLSFSFHGNDNIVTNTENRLKLIKAIAIVNPALIQYLSERRIPVNIANVHCKEVHYSINNRNYYAVGFKTDAGSYELSSKYFKGCSSPKTITTIDNKNNSCLVFEGFMDFLSYLTLKKTQRPISSVCVLNSVNQLNKAMEFIGKHDTIHVFADNDEAGNRMLKTIESAQKTVIDQRTFYKNYKDLNEYLCDKSDMPKQNVKSGFRRKM